MRQDGSRGNDVNVRSIDGTDVDRPTEVAGELTSVAGELGDWSLFDYVGAAARRHDVSISIYVAPYAEPSDDDAS